MSSSSKKSVYAETSADFSTVSSNYSRSVCSTTSQNSLSQYMPSDSEQSSGGNSEILKGLRIDQSNPPSHIHLSLNAGEFTPSPQGLQRNLVNTTPLVPPVNVNLPPVSNNLPPLLPKFGLSPGNQYYAWPTVSATSSPQFLAVNGCCPTSYADPIDLYRVSRVLLITTGVHSECNACHEVKDIMKFNCGNSLCKECIFIKCILDIKEFYYFLEKNDLQNLKTIFNYRCPVCSQSFKFPTDTIFNFVKIWMESHKLHDDELVYREEFPWLDMNRTRLIEFSPYFDGTEAKFVGCKCGSICLQLPTNVFLCRNCNKHSHS